MIEQLPILQIVIPLAAAPVCILLRRAVPALAFATAVCWSAFAMAVLLLLQVLDHGTISYALGNWEPPWGIEYRVDLLSAFVLLFVSGIAAIVITYAPRSLEAEIPEEKRYLFCAAYLLCMTGLLGIAITGDLFNVFVFLEISSLSSYAMISLGASRRALTAAFQYLILGTVGATFILIGIGLLYMMTGTLNMQDLALRIPWDTGGRTVLVATGFLSVGVCIKMALFPLHLWLPNAYTYAPSVVTSFLAATATKVSVYLLLRLVFTIFSRSGHFEDSKFHVVLMVMALMAMFVASAVAIFQTDIKRMLAYSSLAQIGYMVLGISFASVAGLTGGIVHLFNHALIKGGMFLAMGCIALRVGSVKIHDLQGVGKRMPVTMFLWVIGGLGLIGVPATAGFVSKWYLVVAALDSGFWPIAVLILMSSLLAVVYVWRVVEVAYFRKPPAGSETKEAPLGMLVPACVLIGLTIYFGLDSSASAGVAERAARMLLGGVR
jgi:multicomponent Na+:H+ antiporter subunit D